MAFGECLKNILKLYIYIYYHMAICKTHLVIKQQNYCTKMVYGWASHKPKKS